ncbi:MAG TPA: hypothetical protein VKR31_03880, partial [Rhizomicrobium sp.]|nr:hypothetical protein [Rhizomicrobium sp.]
MSDVKQTTADLICDSGSKPAGVINIGDTVTIDVPWAEPDFPNCEGKVVGLRHGGSVCLIETDKDKPYRVLHVKYLERKA